MWFRKIIEILAKHKRESQDQKKRPKSKFSTKMMQLRMNWIFEVTGQESNLRQVNFHISEKNISVPPKDIQRHGVSILQGRPRLAFRVLFCFVFCEPM